VKLRNADSSRPILKKSAKRQTSIAASFSNVIPYDKKRLRWKEIMDAVTYYIAKDMVPIFTVEKPCFKNLLGTDDHK
jgi:protein tyrosine phosphatase